MNKVLERLKSQKKVLAILLLIIALIGAVIYINTKSVLESQTSSEVVLSDTERKLSEILGSIAGVGEAQVMINQTDEGICGVVIVCGGGNNIMVRNDILNAVSTALNVEKNIIAIYAMN